MMRAYHGSTSSADIPSSCSMYGVCQSAHTTLKILVTPVSPTLAAITCAYDTMAAAGGPQTDNAAIAEAEKKVGGKKDD
ncbi:hypothetical protein D9758_018769 [Tetrapyrgos nigripes]|uniref:Uncharacterized protein n=1 Tax=Tetrapyrgos nigripes TaxID=182062 RepID=A0A8H5ET68_9AGAR|nr:hypothetical protein D9758_018769 [Tetrapyrgos nigripes]